MDRRAPPSPQRGLRRPRHSAAGRQPAIPGRRRVKANAPKFAMARCGTLLSKMKAPQCNFSTVQKPQAESPPTRRPGPNRTLHQPHPRTAAAAAAAAAAAGRRRHRARLPQEPPPPQAPLSIARAGITEPGPGPAGPGPPGGCDLRAYGPERKSWFAASAMRVRMRRCVCARVCVCVCVFMLRVRMRRSVLFRSNVSTDPRGEGGRKTDRERASERPSERASERERER